MITHQILNKDANIQSLELCKSFQMHNFDLKRSENHS